MEEGGGRNNGFSIGAMACGGIAFLFFPIVLGPVGIVLASIGLSKKESLAPVGITVAILGTVIGMYLGMLAWAEM